MNKHIKIRRKKIAIVHSNTYNNNSNKYNIGNNNSISNSDNEKNKN